MVSTKYDYMQTNLEGTIFQRDESWIEQGKCS